MGHEKLLFENDELCVGTCLFSVCVALLAFLCTEFSSDFRIYSVGVCVCIISGLFIFLFIHTRTQCRSHCPNQNILCVSLSWSYRSFVLYLMRLDSVCYDLLV